MTETATPRTPGDPVAWASEWEGIGGQSRAIHTCEHEARNNAEWMGGSIVPLIPASDISQAIKERDEAVRLLTKATDQIRECRLADGHAARTGKEGRWDRALHSLTASEPEYRAFLTTMEKRCD